MQNQTIKNNIIFGIVLTFSLMLTACNGFFDKDNTPQPTPLQSFTPEIKPYQLWAVQAGSGTSDDYLKMGPTIAASTIFTASTKGIVTAINKVNGHINWQVNTQAPLMASPGAYSNLVVVGSQRGEVIALQAQTGKIQWRTTVPGEILAKPAVSIDQVVVKTIDGYVRALSSQDGHELWVFKQTEPTLILRGSSAPLIRDHAIIAGFANGHLAKLSLEGQLIWLQTIAIPEGAFTIQRMIDIDADPILFERHLYAATYQGKITSLDWQTGKIRWAHDISSYTGMIADSTTVYISDAKSKVWAFGADNGLVNWQQVKLEARVISGPATLKNYVVVGDAQGYLHWLNKQDGHFAAREQLGSAIYASPIVDNDVLYVLTKNGRLIAYVI